MADQFGTSLITARNAIKPLVAVRDLELLVNRTFCVPKMSRQRLDANHRFHFLIYRAAKSIEILPIFESMWLQVGPFLNGVITQFGVENAQDNHTEVIKALRRGDAQAAAASAIRNDLVDAADIILSNADFVMDGEPPMVRRAKSTNGRLDDSATNGWLGEYKKTTMENRV